MQGGGLTPVQDVAAFVLAAMRAVAPRDVALLEAAGLVVAEDVVAGAELPRFDNSAMDGYAVRAAPAAENVGAPGGGRRQKSSTKRRTSAGASSASPVATVRIACTS